MNHLTRRQFLNKSIEGTAVLAASAAFMTARTRAQVSPGDKIVLGLIGAGGRGASHAAGMSKLDGVEFKYVCDVWEQRGANILRDLEKTQRFVPKRVSDMRRVLDDKEVNAVVIATPEHWHALATVWACQAGKDVYVEKCPSISIWEGRKMIEAARKYRRI